MVPSNHFWMVPISFSSKYLHVVIQGIARGDELWFFWVFFNTTACYWAEPKKVSFHHWSFHVLACNIFPVGQYGSSLSLVLIYNIQLMPHITAFKSKQCFQITGISESNLSTVTFTLLHGRFPVVFLWLFRCKRKKKRFLWKYNWYLLALGSLGTSGKTVEIICHILDVYFRLAHVLFGLLIWSVSYPKLKENGQKLKHFGSSCLCVQWGANQFLWGSYLWDSFAQEKRNSTSPLLVIANHNFNNHVSTLRRVSVLGPQWYH